ncbi:MAG: sce7725 family protein [Candidatus Electryonea clarkiae]|nr:sce7725 family protein [Candidatus Electryonea clarkiae]MDP8288828.1 sce7725 family protein [Candidatus Electryonea clarkiae]
MYFPYFRGKQYELIALREASEWLNAKSVIPIVEPVRSNYNNLINCISTIHSNKQKLGLVINPNLGDFSQDSFDKSLFASLETDEFHGTLIPVILLNNSTTLDTISGIFELFDNNHFIIVHNGINDYVRSFLTGNNDRIDYHVFDEQSSKSRSYRSRFDMKKRVILEDAFIHAQKNAEYPEENYFSDLCFYYNEDNYVGFGDYGVVGKVFSDTGGPAYAVAIHLTYQKEKDQLFVRHFISDSNDKPVNVAGKFNEALLKFVSFYQSHETILDFSSACKELLDLNERQHYPGLGYLKKLTIQHHLELINKLVLENV